LAARQILVALDRGHGPEPDLRMVVGGCGEQPGEVVEQFLGVLRGDRQAALGYPAFIDESEAFLASVLADEALVAEDLAVIADSDARSEEHTSELQLLT